MTEIAEMTRSAVKAATEKNGPLSDPKKMAVAGIGLAALPVAVEAVAKRVAPKVADLGDQAKQAAKGAVASKVPGLSEGDGQGEGLLSKLKPGSSNDDGGEEGRAAPGQGGSGRRMPIQQSVDVAVPIKVAYDRWTGFEDWPDFMQRIK